MELSEKVKELVAVGASITANCQPCLQYHAEKAFASGADPEEVKAAIEVGKRVRKGASAKMDAYSSGLMEAAQVPEGTRKSACCGGLS
ncbi:MAG: carboxymuconolactone decarboxylase family protein [bacterium]